MEIKNKTRTLGFGGESYDSQQRIGTEHHALHQQGEHPMPIADPEIRAAREPLSKKEFKRAIEQGLGRAILCLQKHNPEPYKEIILEACLKNTLYDMQCEDSRVPYLMQAIDLCQDENFFCDAILKALLKISAKVDVKRNRRHQWQLIDLVLIFAKRQHTQAKALLYECFTANPKANEKFSLDYDDAIIELDGLDGLVFVLEQYAKVIQKQRDFTLEDHYLSSVSQQFGKAVIEQKITDLCNINGDVKRLVESSKLLENISRFPFTHRKKFKPPRPTYDSLQNKIRLRSPYPSGIPYWSKWATQAQLKRAARDLQQETDPELMRGYLYVFRQRKFPYSMKHLFRLVKHKNQDVYWGAVFALHHFKHPQVRVLALEILGQRPQNSEVMRLFEQNYVLGDHEKLVHLSKTFREADEIHQAGYYTRDIYSTNRVSEALEPLLLDYETNRCSMCRASTIVLLHELGILPDWVLEEAQFDSDDGIRQKAQAWAAARVEQPLPIKS
jgi:hypothetical protein